MHLNDTQKKQLADQRTKHILFVGQLTSNATPDDIKAFFVEKTRDQAISVRPLHDKRTKAFRGIAFVEFSSSEALQKGLELNTFKYKGRRLSVERTVRVALVSPRYHLLPTVHTLVKHNFETRESDVSGLLSRLLCSEHLLLSDSLQAAGGGKSVQRAETLKALKSEQVREAELRTQALIDEFVAKDTGESLSIPV